MPVPTQFRTGAASRLYLKDVRPERGFFGVHANEAGFVRWV
jgi:hypothetical protein